MIYPENLDAFMAYNLKEEYLRLKDDDGSLFAPGEKQKLVEAMALVHDWFCFPSQWIVTKVNND